MHVRCKFKVESVTHHNGGSTSIKLSAVTSGSEENKAFWKYTPSGQMEFHTVNDAAAEQFKPGAELYVDFSLPGA